VINKIHLGDSVELYKQLEDNSISLVVADPPFILDMTPPSNKKSKGLHGGLFLDSDISKKIKNISDGFDIDLHLTEWERVLKKFNAFIFCSNKQISSLMKWGEDKGYVTTCLVWWKYNAPPLCNGNWISDIEYCIHIREKGATFQGGADLKHKVYRDSIVKSQYNHPTVKPLELVKQYIQIGSNENDIILDPFAGSGTTLHGAYQLNRRYIGFEIDKEYHKIAVDRLKSATGEVGLFA